MLQTLKNSNGSRQKLPMLLISQNENQEPGCMCLQSKPYNSTQRHCCQRIKSETHQDTASNNYQVTRSTGYMRIQQMPQGCCCSLLFSHAVGSESFQPHGLKDSRLPCPSPTPRAFSYSCPLSRWYHPTISSSVVPFSSRLQSFLALESFPMLGFKWVFNWAASYDVFSSRQLGMVVKSMNLRARLSGFESWLSHSLDLQPWKTYLLVLQFLHL